MNFYQFHIGDYIKQTVHLTPMEDLCYRRLMDMYYETEHPITTETDRVSRRLRLDTELVDSVLKEFFILTENGWENARCNKEIEAYHVKASTARANGKLGGRPIKTKPVSDRNPQESASKANQEPVTNNHKPVTNTKPKSAPAAPLPDWLPGDSWNDYLENRKQLKAPMTDRAKLLAIAKLSELRQSGHDPTAVLNQSVYNGWKGLFPIKADMNTNAKGQTRHEQLADKLADLTGSRRAQSFDPRVIHGTAERLD